MSEISENAPGFGNARPKKPSKKKTIEQTYQKLTQLEHVLLRPDTYIGSTARQAQTLWVHDGGDDGLVQRTVEISPGLYKIFDEILVNAADNKVRDPSMDTLRVDIDAEAGRISIENNGAGVPIEVHSEHGIYVPELIFGNLLTSSNYNDDEKKVTGGRNGYGAKLANIFSTEFIVETCDATRRRRYRQVFRNNMSEKGEPVITTSAPGESWTRITFAPDLARFSGGSAGEEGEEEVGRGGASGSSDLACGLDRDAVALFRKRVYDMAGILGKGVKVYLDGKRLAVSSFSQYVDLYLGPKSGEGAPPRFHERVNDRWEVVIALSDGQFNQVSFVNSICTSKGGTHVNLVEGQVTKHVGELLAKKHKGVVVKPHMIKSYLWVFVNALVENPAFDSQAKETLTLQPSAFGSKCPLSDKLLKAITTSGLVDSVLSLASFRANKELKKGDGSKRSRITGIPKLADANDAGTRHSDKCTLILTEGDSAKTLAISGLSVVGRDKYGVFPLRGKLLNVRDASASQVSGNAEIQSIKQILGLQHGKTYTDVKSLRYGHLMIMTDQDHDGSHIKGLIMNYLHHFYPSLLRLPGFLVEFITPIVVATRGQVRITFFTLPQYEEWRETESQRGWKIKYYKGLGTSTSEEAKRYFAALDAHRKEFFWSGDEDGASLEMAFSKKKVEERKDWLRHFRPGTFLDHSQPRISYKDFVHRELILFSRADLERSIPSVMDGLKPGQRKILFACFKRNLRNDVKVAQLVGYVAEHSAYHHGEASLQATIVGLAQDFVGSNNVNLMVPQGQFGTRLMGGKDAASPRYIFTRLAPIARALFHPADDALLAYQNEEGQVIEPEWYAPVLPTVLVNGAEGIGTGWSTSVPNYNPRDVVDNLRRAMRGELLSPMRPWYRGFKGTVVDAAPPTRAAAAAVAAAAAQGLPPPGPRSYVLGGTARQVDETTLEVTELPIRRWTQDYKEMLEEMLHPAERSQQPFISDYKEHHTDTSVRFTITLPEASMRAALAEGLENKFKLTTRVSTGNMMLFDADGAIRKYESPEDVLAEFYHVRLELYARRRQTLIAVAKAELKRIANRVRFILAVVDGEVSLGRRPRADVEVQLEADGYDRLPARVKAPGAVADAQEGEGGDATAAKDDTSYEYLLSMQLGSLTREKVEALQAEAEAKRAEVTLLEATTEKEMWDADLDAFLDAWGAMEEADKHRDVLLIKQRGGVAKKAAGKAAAQKKGGKKAAWSESDEESASSDEESEEEDRIPAPRPRPRPAASLASAGSVPLAPPRRAVAAGEASSTQSSRQSSQAAAARSAPPPPKPAAPKPYEEMSLLERMQARLNGLELASRGPGLAEEASGPTTFAGLLPREATPVPAPAPDRVVPWPTLDAEPGPEPEPRVAPTRRAAASTRGRGRGRSEVARAAAPRATSARAAASRTSTPPSSSGGEEQASTPAPPADTKRRARVGPAAAAAGADAAPSPLVQQAAKVQRMRPSPFHRGSGSATAAAAAAPARAKPDGRKPSASSSSEVEVSDSSDDSVVDESPAPRAVAPRRRAAVGPPPGYRDKASDESEPESSESESEASDDYVPSD